MGKECWIRAAQPIEPVPRALGPMDHPLVFAASPSNDIGIDPFQGWTQLRRIEVAVVVNPAPDARVVHRGQIAEGLVAAVMKRPVPDLPTDARQCLWAGSRQEAVCEDAPIRLDPHRLSGSELVAQKIEMDVRVVAVPVHILAIDDPCLLRMENQLADRKAVGNRTPEGPCVLLGSAVTDHVVRIALEGDVRELPRHPFIERVVQEQVRQQRRDHPALWRSRLSRYDPAILHLHGRLQPALEAAPKHSPYVDGPP